MLCDLCAMPCGWVRILAVSPQVPQAVVPHADTKVWAFNPPGGMVSANLSHALEGFVTSVRC